MERSMNEVQSSPEEVAAAACRGGDYRAAATCIYRAYGTEIYSFLLAQFRGDESCAEEVFSEFTEDFWRGLPSFEWRCAIRAWCYKLARHAASRFRRSRHNRPDKHLPLATQPFLEQLAHEARTSTRPYLKTQIKDEFQRLRDLLTREEQDLLILRVDRDLSWRDIAFDTSAEENPSEEELKRREVSLRQRFTQLKRRLRDLAEKQGLL
jgi:RNA polymerase sigma-70 factor (ECF subfamily)